MEDFNSDSHDQFLRLYVENEEALEWVCSFTRFEHERMR